MAEQKSTQNTNPEKDSYDAWIARIDTKNKPSLSILQSLRERFKNKSKPEVETETLKNSSYDQWIADIDAKNKPKKDKTNWAKIGIVGLGASIGIGTSVVIGNEAYHRIFDAPSESTPVQWEYKPVTKNLTSNDSANAAEIKNTKSEENCNLVIVGDTTAAYSATKTAMNEKIPDVCLVIPKSINEFGGRILSTQIDFPHGKNEAAARGKLAENLNSNFLSVIEQTTSQNQGWVSNRGQDLLKTKKLIKSDLEKGIQENQIKVFDNSQAISIESSSGRLDTITISSSRGKLKIKGDNFIDATATGELLPLSESPYELGYQNNPEAVNSTTIPIAVKIVSRNSQEGLDYNPEVITSENLAKFQKELSKIKKPDKYSLFKYLFNYRSDKPIEPNSVIGSQAVLNMGFNDYMKPIIKNSQDTKVELDTGWNGGLHQDRLKEAQELSKQYLTFLNTLNPYPNTVIIPREEIANEGLLQPYFRSSRRAVGTKDIQPIGIVSYPADIHPVNHQQDLFPNYPESNTVPVERFIFNGELATKYKNLKVAGLSIGADFVKSTGGLRVTNGEFITGSAAVLGGEKEKLQKYNPIELRNSGTKLF
jgi:FAD dependent oxidoreductase